MGQGVPHPAGVTDANLPVPPLHRETGCVQAEAARATRGIKSSNSQQESEMAEMRFRHSQEKQASPPCWPHAEGR
ncbi:hypothetical protein P7K49_008930, partial [Saguinus oedipus]